MKPTRDKPKMSIIRRVTVWTICVLY